jgi:hypothetical protein
MMALWERCFYFLVLRLIDAILVATPPTYFLFLLVTLGTCKLS